MAKSRAGPSDIFKFAQAAGPPHWGRSHTRPWLYRDRRPARPPGPGVAGSESGPLAAAAAAAAAAASESRAEPETGRGLSPWHCES